MDCLTAATLQEVLEPFTSQVYLVCTSFAAIGIAFLIERMD